jgi:heterodisulfide reductase subunit A-like polyferredoxin
MEEGEKRIERFQMIVIATQRKLSDSIKTVGEQLGLKLSQNVDASEDNSQEETAKNGIAVAGGIATR